MQGSDEPGLSPTSASSSSTIPIAAGYNSSGSPIKAEKDAKQQPNGLTNGHTNGHTNGQTNGAPTDKPAKPKQRRNKPTLSCLECVERKTKCDRGRPCVACVKRQSSCEYTAVANMLASAHKKGPANGKRAPHMAKPANKNRKMSIAASTREASSPTSDRPMADIETPRPPVSSASPLYSGLPFSKASPSNVFGVGSQHPFSNYWTCQGGLPEVISVLPSKDQADILIAKYFECVDPVYPFLHRRSFYADYERFWALPAEEKNTCDASLMALHYAMYALGTQFMEFPSYEERSQTAEFYCSAANQALRVYSYLNRTSMRAMSAMLLMAYFLMNDNHASDAYAWAGIHLRQAYAMRLHRDPDLVVPDAPVLEKQARRKLWQAVFFQDTFLTILLKLPPTATHSDVPVESMSNENELSMDGLDCGLGTHSRVENLMSINVIAPQAFEPMIPPQPHHLVDAQTMKNDVTYMRCMWHLGNLVQENLSSPLSLSLPICSNPKHKEGLVSAFKRLYKSFPSHLTTLDYATLQQQAALYPRAVRQNLFLTSNYHHCLMLLHASENEPHGVRSNIKAALEAAHEALWAFFKLWGLFENEAGVWWVFQHRAFEESLLIAHLLAENPPSSVAADGDAPMSDGADGGSPRRTASRDGGHGGPDSDADICHKTKGDVSKMLGIMERYGGSLEMHATRKEVLREAFDRICF